MSGVEDRVDRDQESGGAESTDNQSANTSDDLGDLR